MKKLITILVLLLTQMVFGQTATAPAAGNGTSENPYQIASLENLYWIAASDAVVPSPTKVTRWAAHYIQTTDIDASATSGWPSGGWTPIGNDGTNFTGSYNGQGHTISGIKTNRQVNFQGLFGAVLSATIQNLGVTSVNIAGLQYFGGLAGAVNNSTVSKCFSTGSVSLGGSTSYLKAGGLIGVIENSSDVSNCYSTANIENQSEIGGFAYSITNSNVSNCYSTGTAAGSEFYGGFAGTVGNSTVSNCFWDTETSGTESSAGGTGKTTAQLKTQVTYTDWDFTNIWWMTDGETRPFLRTEWSTTIGNSHQLQLMSMDVTAAYVLNNNIDLSDIKVQKEMWGTSGSSGSGFVPIGNGSTHFTGSFNGQGFAIDGLYMNRPVTSYIGLFGSASAATIQNLGVTNINFTGTGNVGGIAGYTVTSGTISNCYATGTIAANNDYVGGLVGYNWKANISRCYANVTVTVSGDRNYTGGLVGFNTEAVIQDCYSRGDVSGYNYVGGLVGSHTINTLIDKCYSIGNVTGTLNTGGLVGYNNSTVTASFWNSDIEAVGIGGGTTTGATGKTTAVMKTQSTFLDAGWSSAIWYMDAGFNSGYPYLEWQNPGGSPLPVELTSFTASVSGGKVTLNWQTATEVNNYGFEIERTSPRPSPQGEGGEAGRGWEKIGFVAGNGNSNSPKDYSFVDKTVLSGKYFYRLKQIDNDGQFEYSNIVEVDLGVPAEFSLAQNYPNPFNPSTTIKYQLPERSLVTLKLYDILGREVHTLINEDQSPGNYKVELNGSRFASGVYIYRITAGKFTAVKKLTFSK